MICIFQMNTQFQVRWSRLLATIEAHRMISRARQRAHLVTGDTLIKVETTSVHACKHIYLYIYM